LGVSALWNLGFLLKSLAKPSDSFPFKKSLKLLGGNPGNNYLTKFGLLVVWEIILGTFFWEDGF